MSGDERMSSMTHHDDTTPEPAHPHIVKVYDVERNGSMRLVGFTSTAPGGGGGSGRTAGTSGLVAFLTARLDEDEQWARETAGPDYSEPHDEGAPGHHGRVLDEVEAKRAILTLHETQRGYHGRPDGEFCLCQDADGVLTGEEPCETKRLLASVYRSHPDWREDWTA